MDRSWAGPERRRHSPLARYQGVRRAFRALAAAAAASRVTAVPCKNASENSKCVSSCPPIAPPPGLAHPQDLPRRYFLELFAGCCRLTNTSLIASLAVAQPMELKLGEWHDLTDPRVQAVVMDWVGRGLIWCVWFGTPCTRWSSARTTGGVGNSVDRVGLACTHFTIRLAKLCFRKGCFYVLENPKTSKIFDYPPLKDMLARHSASSAIFDQCVFGMPYRKSTRLVGTLPGLETWSHRCTCTVPHEVLSGLAVMPFGLKVRPVWKTTLAGAYSPSFCRFAAAALRAVAPPGAFHQHGPPLLAASWSADLCRSIGRTFHGRVDIPSLPSRDECPWADAVGFHLDDGSRLRRQAALRRHAPLAGDGPLAPARLRVRPLPVEFRRWGPRSAS